MHRSILKFTAMAILSVFTWGCGSSMCSLSRDQKSRVDELQKSIQAIQGHPQVFSTEYRDQAANLKKNLDGISKPFDCKEQDTRDKELLTVADQLNLLSNSALQRCLVKAGALLSQLDNEASNYPPTEELFQKFKRERNVQPTELVKLDGCLRHLDTRQKLLDEMKKSRPREGNGTNLAEGGNAAENAVKTLRGYAGRDWWKDISPAQLESLYKTARSSRWSSQADTLYQQANRRFEDARNRALTELDDATKRCDETALNNALTDLEALGTQQDAIDGYKDKYHSKCHLEASGKRWAARIKKVTDEFSQALADGNLQSLRLGQAMDSIVDVVESLREQKKPVQDATAAQGINLESLYGFGDYLKNIRGADAALATGNWSLAQSQLKTARGSSFESQLHLVADRQARLNHVSADSENALALQRVKAHLQQGNYAEVWKLLKRLKRNSEVVSYQVKATMAALTHVQSPADVLLWARRARNLDIRNRLSLDTIVKIMAAAARPEASTEDLKLGLVFLRGLGASGIKLDRRALVAGASLLHRVAMAGIESGVPLQKDLDTLVARAISAGAVDQQESTQFSNLLVYHEIAMMVRDALQGIEDEISNLSPERAGQLRSGLVNTVLKRISKSRLVSRAALVPREGEITDQLLRRAVQGGGWGVSEDGSRSVLVVDTSAGRLALIFRLPTIGSRERSEMENLLRSTEAETLGIIAAIRIEMISGRVAWPVSDRKMEVRRLLDGIRWRMGGVVLAYAGLFNAHSGLLEVPTKAADFFLVPELRNGRAPVFQDQVSREALKTIDVKHQVYRLGEHPLEDVAVAVNRGRNRIGVLRLGVLAN